MAQTKIPATQLNELAANLLINGDLTVWQRGASFVAAANNQRIADKYRYQKSGTMVHDITRDADVPTIAQSGHKSNYSIKLDVTTADAAIAAGDYCGLQTVLEGYDYAPLKDQTITVSFWVKATKTGAYCVSFRNNGNDRSYIAEYTVNSTLTWEKKIITIPLNQTGGTESYTHTYGLGVFFTQACGSTFSTTPNAWQTGNFIGSANQVNGTDNTANNFWISQIKLEKSLIATPFVARLFNDELTLCRRYNFKTFDYAIAPANNLGTLYGVRWPAPTAGATTHRPPSFLFPVPMRIAPAITFYNPLANNAQARDVTGTLDCSATAVGAVSETLVDINCTGAAGTAVGNSIIVCLTAEADF